MLVFAYLVLFLPQSVGTVVPCSGESATRRICRSLGKTPWQTLKALSTFSASGVLSGAVLVFLTAIKELPATYWLRLALTHQPEIWKATENVAFSDSSWITGDAVGFDRLDNAVFISRGFREGTAHADGKSQRGFLRSGLSKREHRQKRFIRS